MNREAVTQRVAELRDRITLAGGQGVGIVAVTKTFGIDSWWDAKYAGCDAIGENYAQELISKAQQIDKVDRLPVHFIGQLQTNKIRSLFGVVDVWQSVDRAALIAELSKRHAARSDAGRCEIFLQVNTTNELNKGGCLPSAVGGLAAMARDGGLDVTGLMAVGPTDLDPQKTRAAFRLLKGLTKDHGIRHASMGMTHDVEIAVEEGSTLVRVGTAIFGERPHSP